MYYNVSSSFSLVRTEQWSESPFRKSQSINLHYNQRLKISRENSPLLQTRFTHNKEGIFTPS